jgi:hypothetical protein
MQLSNVALALAALGATALAHNQDEFWAAPNYLPSTLYRVDWPSGNATPIGIIPNIEPTDLALASDGTLYVSTMDELYRVSTTDASSVFVGTIPTFSSVVGLDFGPAGTLYAVTYTGAVMTLDPSTGQALTSFNLPVNFAGDVAAFDASTLYAAVESANGANLIRIDLGSQTHVDLGGIAPPDGVWSLDFDGAGSLIAITLPGDVYEIPNYSTSGAGVYVSSTNQGALGGMTSADGGCPSIGAYCTAGFTSNFCSATMSAAGTPSATASSGFTLSMSGGEPQKQGILFYGVDNTGFVPAPWGLGSSWICVKQPVQRMGAADTGGTIGMCDGTLWVDWNAFVSSNPGAVGTPFSAGQQVYAQGWFRDPPSPKTTSLSNGLTFVVCP